LLLWDWNPWSYTLSVGRCRFLSAGTARSGGCSRGGDAWAGEGGATGALLWWTLEDLFKRSGYTSNLLRIDSTDYSVAYQGLVTKSQGRAHTLFLTIQEVDYYCLFSPSMLNQKSHRILFYLLIFLKYMYFV
jgi:hypothetical protein